MRLILMVAAGLVAGGTVMAQVADRMTVRPAHVVARAETVGTGPRSVSISRDRRGHFQTDIRVDGQRIGVMVDTGASVLALNESSAARIGVRPSRGDYTAMVATANGTIRGARTRIPMVQVGTVTVRDVDAMVLPDAALSENLLGLSFLSRLKRYEFAGSNLVLEQ